MAHPVEVYIGNPNGDGWSRSIGWTSLTLSRSKDALTGSLKVEYFYGYVPQEPVAVDAAFGRDILVYVDGWLAFNGIIDGRQGTGTNSGNDGEGASLTIGPDQYTVSLTARGKTKTLIDSSHDVPQDMNGSNTEDIVTRLVEGWGIDINWDAAPQALKIWRFRQGARISEELSRLARENAHYIYEGRDGTLTVTDGTSRTSGDDLVLGRNILTFQATQNEAEAKSVIRVRGQTSEVGSWGEDAVLPGVRDVVGDILQPDETRRVSVQHYGDASEASLERRGMYEANKRTKASKNVTVEVFSVDTASGQPWDIGQLHRVVIPPEGVDTILECTGLRINCNETNISTSLTLSPIPQGVKQVTSGPLANMPAEDLDQIASGSNIRYVGQYPAPWTVGSWVVNNVPLVGDLLSALGSVTSRIFGGLRSLEGVDGRPPDRIE